MRRNAALETLSGVHALTQVVVWNIATKEIRTTVAGFHKVGLLGLAWSPCGGLLASVGADERHSLLVVEVSTAKAVFSAR